MQEMILKVNIVYTNFYLSSHVSLLNRIFFKDRPVLSKEEKRFCSKKQLMAPEGCLNFLRTGVWIFFPSTVKQIFENCYWVFSSVGTCIVLYLFSRVDRTVGPSRLCKKSLFDLYREICSKKCFTNISYKQVKLDADCYNQAKMALHKRLQDKNYGFWVCMPREVDRFLWSGYFLKVW